MKRRAMNLRDPSKPGKGERGFTFVEILLALAVGAIVIVGMYQAFNTLHKWWIATGIRSDMRQNARAGLETLTRDLEMAGYQTSTYDDVNKIGLAITLASTNEIEMDQQRLDSTTSTPANPVYEPRLVYYHLATDMRTGRQNLYRQIRTKPGQPTPDEIVAENVSAFILGFLDKDNKKFKDPSDPVDPVNLPNPPYRPGTQYAVMGTVPAQYSFGSAPPAVLKNIRRIQVLLTTIPARAAPFGPTPKPFTLMASVMPQNLGAADEVTADTTPPATPRGLNGPNDPNALAVIDKRSCTEKLRVKWKQSTEPDIASYRLYYKQTGYDEVFVSPVTVVTDREQTLNPRELLITKYTDRTTAPNTYVIQIAAVDKTGNVSEKSAPVAGNPSTDTTDFNQVPFFNDTTVNPLKPSVPTGFTVNARANEELDLSWQAPADGSATVGYRLYRSTTPFGANEHIDGSLQIVRETTLATGVTTWTDKPEACRDNQFITYYYAVASVNCDETLFNDLSAAGYHTNSSPALSDYAVASGTPQDTTGPKDPPGLSGSQPEQQRTILLLTNPLELDSADFDRTEIWWSKVAPPTFNGTTVSGGVLLPERERPGGSDGIFQRRGSQVIVFESELDTVRPLTYYFLAVSYDRCGNPSDPTALALVIPPGACAATPLVAPPYRFTGAMYSSCQPGSVEIGWEYPDLESVAGFAGFRITRFFLDGMKDRELTAGPTSHTSWTDADILKSGTRYYYEVKATDCLYEQDPILNSLNASIPYRIPNPGGTISPGQLQRFAPSADDGHELDAENFVTSISDAATPYTYHNNVKFFLQNTSSGQMTIKRMAVSWDSIAVVLDSVTIGGGSSRTTEKIISAGGAASGNAFPVNATIEDFATGAGSPSDAVPVVLRFTTLAGAVNRLVDMRNEALSVSLWVGDHSAQDAACHNPTSITIDVPRGPELRFFSQSAPGKDGLDSYAVIGPSGTARDTDIKVSTGIGVNVFGTAVDHSGRLFPDGINRGFEDSKLRVLGISAEAAASDAVPTMPAVGTSFVRRLYSLGCDRSIGGDRYAIHYDRTPPLADCGALMRQEANKVHWYYVLAVDKTGNWDRLPNPDYGNYAYFQKYPVDICLYTPEMPVLTSALAAGSEVILTWAAPTIYSDTDHTTIVSDDILTYDVYYNKDAAGWTLAPNGANRSSLRYDHSALSGGSPPLPAGTYRYKVQAKNSCFSCVGTDCTLCIQGGCCSACSNESSAVVMP